MSNVPRKDDRSLHEAEEDNNGENAMYNFMSLSLLTSKHCILIRVNTVFGIFFPIRLPFTHSFTLAILCLFVYLNTAPSGRPGVDVLERFVVYEATYAENCRRSRRNFA